MKPILLTLTHLFIAATLQAQTIYVDATATGTNNGTSWTNAYQTLSSALNTAKTNMSITEIQVARGIYFPTGDADGTGRNAAFRIGRNNLRLLGGYPNGGGARNPSAYTTTLNGDIGTAGNSGDNSFHVVFITGITGSQPTVAIDGFTITNGNASDNYNTPTGRGGGIYLSQVPGNTVEINQCIFSNNSAGLGGGIFNGAASPTISNCLFQNNTAYIYGGGVSSRDAAPKFIACTFDNNRSLANNIGTAGGGAIENRNCSPAYISCIITNNKAIDGNGGGLYTRHSQVTISKCIFENNQSTNGANSSGDGGAIFDYDYDVGDFGPYTSHNTITNTKFIGNKASGDGGAMYNVYSNATATNCLFLKDTARRGSVIQMEANSGATIELTNCTIYGNYSPGSSGGVLSMLGSGSFLRINNSIVWNNNTGLSASPAAGITWANSLVQGQTSTANGNLSETGIPADGSTLFTNILSDYTLATNSPVIDKGSNSLYNNNVYGNADLAGYNRIANSIIDMGAYEASSTVLPVTFSTLSAFIHNQVLQVNWTSQTETNNDHFEIEGSFDGQHFRKIASIASRAPGGNASSEMNYEYRINVTEAVSLTGIAGLSVLCLIFPPGKRKRAWLLTALATGLICYSCTKKETEAVDIPGSKLYIRIAQVDKNGTKEYSKVVRVSNE